MLIVLKFSPAYIGSYRFAPVINGAKSWFMLPGFTPQLVGIYENRADHVLGFLHV